MEFSRDKHPILTEDNSGFSVGFTKAALEELLKSYAQQIRVAKELKPSLVRDLQQEKIDIERDTVA